MDTNYSVWLVSTKPDQAQVLEEIGTQHLQSSKSDLRWCSDSFETRCWNGERVHVAFSLDCCDREAISFVASPEYLTGSSIRGLIAKIGEARFGAQAFEVPHPVEWLSDNGPIYTAYETREFGRSIGLLVCTTPAYSPQSNGTADAFIKSFKRDYVYLNSLRHCPSAVLEQLPLWFSRLQRNGPSSRSPDEVSPRIQESKFNLLTCPISYGQLHASFRVRLNAVARSRGSCPKRSRVRTHELVYPY